MSIIEESKKPCIIIDNGSGYCKAGLSGKKYPSSFFKSVIGTPISADIMIGAGKKDYYVGLQAEGKNGILKLNYPIEHGIINNWDDITKIWDYCFSYELRVSPKENNVMLTDTPLNSKNSREKMATIMFETFNTSGFFVAVRDLLSLYSAGKSTGFVCNIGYDVSRFVPIFNGCILSHAISKNDFSGKFLTEVLCKILGDSGSIFNTDAELEIVKQIKETICYIALDYNEEIKKEKTVKYELPDGRKISIGNQRFRCPECLFHPELYGKESGGLDKKSFDSINKCDKVIQKDLYNNIILAGGSSMFKGLSERLSKEMKNLAPENMNTYVNVLALPERKYSAWIGGSILSSLSSFDSMWVTRSEYYESGAVIASHKMLLSTINKI